MKKIFYWRFSRKIEGEFWIFYKRFPWKFFCSENFKTFFDPRYRPPTPMVIKISRNLSCKKFKTHLQFYVKISNKKFSSFFTGKSLYNFSKKLLLRPFFKNSLQEGVFENSLKFLQLLQNFTPIKKLLCTISSSSDKCIYMIYNINKFQEK